MNSWLGGGFVPLKLARWMLYWFAMSPAACSRSPQPATLKSPVVLFGTKMVDVWGGWIFVVWISMADVCWGGWIFFWSLQTWENGPWIKRWRRSVFLNLERYFVENMYEYRVNIRKSINVNVGLPERATRKTCSRHFFIIMIFDYIILLMAEIPNNHLGWC